MNVFEIVNPDAPDAGEKPSWKVNLETMLGEQLNRPISRRTGARICAGMAGPIRDGIAVGDIDPRLLVWDVVQTESDAEAGSVRVLPRHHTAHLVDSGETRVVVLGSLRLEGSEGHDYPELDL